MDHIADFLKFISRSRAQSLWFSHDTSTAMAVTWPVTSVWTPTSMRCFSSSLAWRRIRDFPNQGRCCLEIDNCAIEFEQKKIDLDDYINGTSPSQLKRRKFYVLRIGSKSEQSPNKIEEQIGRDGQSMIPFTRV